MFKTASQFTTEYEELNRIITTINYYAETSESLDEAMAKAIDDNQLDFTQTVRFTEVLGVMNGLADNETVLDNKIKGSYTMTKLYMTLPFTATIFLLTMLAVPNLMDLQVFPFNAIGALAPFVLAFGLRFIDERYFGPSIVKISQLGLITNPVFLVCPAAIKEVADFIQWKDIEWVEYKKFAGFGFIPTLVVKSSRYETPIKIRHFHSTGIKFVKKYTKVG